MKTRILTLLSLVCFVPFAYADDAAAAAHGGGMSSLIMFGGLFVMMYFLMIRPQSKRAKEHRNLLSKLTKDDEVVTQGGMVGRIVRDADSFFIIAVAEGVEFPVQKQSITQLLPKGTLKSIC